jgi:hypothetical protein
VCGVVLDMMGWVLRKKSVRMIVSFHPYVSGSAVSNVKKGYQIPPPPNIATHKEASPASHKHSPSQERAQPLIYFIFFPPNSSQQQQ